MSSTAPASNQDKGKGKQTCRRQQAIIAAHWATQVRAPDDAAPLLALRLSELEIAAHRALAMLHKHACNCIDCHGHDKPICEMTQYSYEGDMPLLLAAPDMLRLLREVVVKDYDRMIEAMGKIEHFLAKLDGERT